MEQQHPPPLSHGKIFVGGLSRETTTSGLREYFERFGDISDCVVMKDRATGLPRGFGFVTYASQIIADRVVLHRHIIDGKEVEAKPAVPRDSEALMSRGTATVSGAANGLPHACAPQAGGDFGTKKIFVGGLAHETSEADFTSYFGESHLSTSRLLKPRRPHVLAHPQLPPPPPPPSSLASAGTFGNVVDCVIMCDPHTRKPRGFGFITYEAADAVERVCMNKFHELNGVAPFSNALLDQPDSLPPRVVLPALPQSLPRPLPPPPSRPPSSPPPSPPPIPSLTP